MSPLYRQYLNVDSFKGFAIMRYTDPLFSGDIYIDTGYF